MITIGKSIRHKWVNFTYFSSCFQILSNLLDLVKDRAEAAEAELERVITEYNEDRRSGSESSTDEKTSVGALSGVSVGSDDVFDGSVFEKAQVVNACNWEVTPFEPCC